jgi:hypothetical protein
MTFSFLKALKDVPTKVDEPIVEETVQKFQTYRLETSDGIKTIAVPLLMVEQFDKFLEELDGDAASVEKYLNKFDAVII